MGETKPSETVLFETKRGKVVGRNVAIALGIICIILVACLGVVLFMSYSPTYGSSTTTLQKQLDDLTSTYNNYVSTHSHTNTDYDTLNTEYGNLQTQNTNLQSQVNDLTSILNLGRSTTAASQETVSQPAGSYNFWNRPTNYCGYVTVTVGSSTTTNTYIRVIWSSYGVDYDNTISVGTSGTGVFPVLPSSNVQIRVGNSNVLNGATETVTITFYY